MVASSSSRNQQEQKVNGEARSEVTSTRRSSYGCASNRTHDYSQEIGKLAVRSQSPPGRDKDVSGYALEGSY